MENKLKKKRIRRAALIVVAAAIVVAAVFAIDFERADYREPLGETVKEAETLLLEAESGYKEGQYLPEIAVEFSEKIEIAKAVYNDESSVYEEQKEAYETLKNDISEFKKSANKKDLTQKEIEKKKSKVAESKSEDDGDKSVSGASSGTNSDKTKTDSKKDTSSKEKKITVTIQIRCDNLSNDMSKLTDESKAAWVPSNGVILGKTEYKCKEGTSVYDVLYAVCRNNNIHVESSYTPMYGSYYIEGINHIYEFDGGSESGWMYKVNGLYPDYGCSSYKLKDGDNIVWGYTCNLGKDLGHEYHE